MHIKQEGAYDGPCRKLVRFHENTYKQPVYFDKKKEEKLRTLIIEKTIKFMT